MKKIYDNVTKFIIICALILCTLNFYKNISFNDYDKTHITYLILLGLIFYSGHHFFKITLTKLFFLFLFFLLVVSNNLILLITTYLLGICSVIAGELFQKINRGKSNDILVNLMIGLAMASSLVSISSHFPINYSAFYWAIILLFIALNKYRFIEINKIIYKFINQKDSNEKQICKGFIEACIASLLAFYLFISLMPEIGYDALVSHLVVPEWMNYYHRWIYDPNIFVWSLGPLNGNWLYTISFLLSGSDLSSRILLFCFLLIICCLILRYVDYLEGNYNGKLVAILLLLSTPITLLVSSSSFTDLIWTAYILAGLLIFLSIKDGEKNCNSELVTSSLLFGMAFGTKLTTLLIFPIILFPFIRFCLDKRFSLIGIFFAGITFIFFGGLSYIYSYVITENPVFPFYNAVFKSSLYPPINFMHPFGSGLSIDLINSVTFNTSKYLEASNGAAGFQWVLLFIPLTIFTLLICRGKFLVILCVLFFFIIAVFYSTGYLRYIFPAFVLFSIFVGSTIIKAKDYNKNIYRVFILLFLLVILSNIYNFKSAGYYSDIKIKVLTDSKEKENYILQKSPMQKSIHIVNELNITNLPVAILSTAPYVAGIKAVPYIAWWYNDKFSNEISQINEPENLGQYMSSLGIKYLVLDEGWSTKEKRSSIESISTLIRKINGVSIRELNDNFKFKKIIDLGNNFLSGWNVFPGTNVLSDGSILVDVEKPATKNINIKGGREYLYEITAMCNGETTDGRMQINWMNKNGVFISASIKTFNCMKNFTKYSEVFVAPEAGAVAIIYASSHTVKKIRIKKIDIFE